MMKHRLNILQTPTEHLKQWDLRAKHLQEVHPLKTPKHAPSMMGITPKTARFLRLKSLFYLLKEDPEHLFTHYFFKRPFFYAKRLIRSYRTSKSFTRQGDFFFYGIQNQEEFTKIASASDPLILIGFSYCHKPFECPSGRFSDQCQNKQDHPVCGQCFIGKCSSLASYTKAKLFYIPTVHYIGKQLFQAAQEHPERPILFLITACEMTLTMFGDWGNMTGAQGIGVRLDGRICNTMKAFVLSEQGIKPGLTCLLEETKHQVLDLILSLSKTSKDAACEKA